MSWDLKEAAEYYRRQGAPGDQSAVISLLREAQQESGGSIPFYIIEELSGELKVKSSFLLAIVKRIPSLRLTDTHCLEVCAGPNCGKHRPIAEAAETVCRQAKGKVSLKFVPCMRMCGKGPNIRWDGIIHHQATVELIRQLVLDENKQP